MAENNEHHSSIGRDDILSRLSSLLCPLLNVATDDDKTLVIPLQRIEMDGEKPRLEVRPFAVVVIDKGKVTVVHLYNKTSFSLALCGILC
jgi:hypothetical protein